MHRSRDPDDGLPPRWTSSPSSDTSGSAAEIPERPIHCRSIGVVQLIPTRNRATTAWPGDRLGAYPGRVRETHLLARQEFGAFHAPHERPTETGSCPSSGHPVDGRPAIRELGD